MASASLSLVCLMLFTTVLVVAFSSSSSTAPADSHLHVERVQRTHYRAAVVEHRPVNYSFVPVSRDKAIEIMMANLDAYEQRLIDGHRLGVQVIVFPEDGLYGSYFPARRYAAPYLERIPGAQDCGHGPHARTGCIPCTNATFRDRPVLTRVSCLARKYAVVLVLDMGDVQPCTESDGARCPEDGHWQYNTQVAFDSSGALLAKYHKSHLYFEPAWDAGPATPTTFQTSFGVRFGMFICYDVMWPEPQLRLLKDMGIRDFVFSSWWVNFPPLITSTQTWQAWSRLHHSHFLASNIGTGAYNGGSGIYDSDGTPLASYYNPTFQPEGRMLVADVPIITHQHEKTHMGEEKTHTSDGVEHTHTSDGVEHTHTSDGVEHTHTSDGVEHTHASDPRGVDADVSSLPLSLSDVWGDASMRPSSGDAPLVHGLGAHSEHQHTTETHTAYTVQTFTATPGRHTLALRASERLQCTATMVVQEPAPVHAQAYGLVGLDGYYNGLFPVQICGLMRCPSLNESSCTHFVQDSNTSVESFTLSGTFLPSSEVQQLAMVATNQAQLMPLSTYQVSSDSICSTAQWNGSPLLNAAIFGVNFGAHTTSHST